MARVRFRVCCCLSPHPGRGGGGFEGYVYLGQSQRLGLERVSFFTKLTSWYKILSGAKEPGISLRCSRTCHEIAGNTRLRNGSQKLVQTPRMDTRICVSISDWLVSYAPSDWWYSCELYHAMLKINIVACIHCIMFYKDLLCISKD